jgi:type IV pilus assembly protein PilE
MVIMKLQPKKVTGFSLIELMIVVAILAILGSIAYPSYQDSVIKSRRSSAQADIVKLAAYMERHFTENNSYTGATVAASGVSNDYYSFAITIPSPPLPEAYTITATATGSQTADTACTPLTLTNTNSKGTKASCW